MFTLNIYKIKSLFTLLVVISFLHGCAAVVAGTAATSAVVAQDRRTAGTIVEDKSIQLKSAQAIKEVINQNYAVNVDAISYNGRVLLVGQVPSKNIRSAIEEEVRGIEKVRQVHNEITLNSPTSGKTRSTDSWITTKIKSEMALTKKFNPTRVKVVTEDGIVYLLGIINQNEEEIAVDIARHTKGVKRVVKIFEYERA